MRHILFTCYILSFTAIGFTQSDNAPNGKKISISLSYGKMFLHSYQETYFDLNRSENIELIYNTKGSTSNALNLSLLYKISSSWQTGVSTCIEHINSIGNTMSAGIDLRRVIRVRDSNTTFAFSQVGKLLNISNTFIPNGTILNIGAGHNITLNKWVLEGTVGYNYRKLKFPSTSFAQNQQGKVQGLRFLLGILITL